jgi:hypothetical protein
VAKLVLLSDDENCHRQDSLLDLLHDFESLMPVGNTGRLDGVLKSALLRPPPDNRLADSVGDASPNLNISAAATVVTMATLADNLSQVPEVARDIAARHGYRSAWWVTPHTLLDDQERTSTVMRFCLTRGLPQYSHRQFIDHYLDVHAPLVLANNPLFLHYVINEPVRERDLHPWGAIIEQYFADTETWIEHDRRIFEEKPAVAEDIKRFLGEIVVFSGHQLVSVGQK